MLSDVIQCLRMKFLDLSRVTSLNLSFSLSKMNDSSVRIVIKTEARYIWHSKVTMNGSCND